MTLRRRTLRHHEIASFELWQQATEDAVVLVHGIGVSSRYFSHLERELSRSVTVLAPDLPGFGRSPVPSGAALSVVEHADVLAALLQDAGLDRPVLVGHSMGCQFVTEVAVRYPDLVGGVVLLDPVTEPGARSAVRQAARLTRDLLREPPRGALLQLREWGRTSLRWYLGTLPHMRDYPLEERLAEVTAPVLLVRGAQDPVAPSDYVRDLAHRAVAASDVRVVEVPGAGHMVMWTRPDVVASLVRGVLRRRVTG